MDMFLAELERHLVLNSDRYGTYPKAKVAIRGYVGQMRHKSDTMEMDEVTFQAAEGERQDQDRQRKQQGIREGQRR